MFSGSEMLAAGGRFSASAEGVFGCGDEVGGREVASRPGPDDGSGDGGCVGLDGDGSWRSRRRVGGRRGEQRPV